MSGLKSNRASQSPITKITHTQITDKIRWVPKTGKPAVLQEEDSPKIDISKRYNTLQHAI